jgi:hypothetical protein
LLGLSTWVAGGYKIKPDHGLLGAKTAGLAVTAVSSVRVRADMGEDSLGQLLVWGNAGCELAQYRDPGRI